MITLNERIKELSVPGFLKKALQKKSEFLNALLVGVNSPEIMFQTALLRQFAWLLMSMKTGCVTEPNPCTSSRTHSAWTTS